MAAMLFTKAILAGEPIKVFNHGRMRRDFTYIDDIVQGLIRVLELPPRHGTAANSGLMGSTTTATHKRLRSEGSSRSSEVLPGGRAHKRTPPGATPGPAGPPARRSGPRPPRRRRRRAPPRGARGAARTGPPPPPGLVLPPPPQRGDPVPFAAPESHPPPLLNRPRHDPPRPAAPASSAPTSCSTGSRRPASRSSTSTSSPTRATSTTSSPRRGDPRHVFVRGDIGDRALVEALLAQPAPARRAELRRRDRTSTARSTAPARSSRPTSSAPSGCSRRRARIWTNAGGRARARSASSTSRPTRCTARSGRDRRRFIGDHALRARTARTRRRRRRPTTWCAPGTTPTACRS